MALPELTDEQRRDALRKADGARRERRIVKDKLKRGEVGVADVLADPRRSIQRLRVYDLIRSLPGYGNKKTEELMAELGIATSRRVGSLGERQRARLIEALGKEG